MIRFIVLLLLTLPIAGADALRPPFRFCYFLFEHTTSEGCSACYIPLLVTRVPLAGAVAPEAAVIETYERDSIWRLRPAPVAIALEGHHDAAARTLVFEGRTYRYQLVANGEALRLLRAPEESIPIHRLAAPIQADGVALQDELLRDLAAVPAP